MAVNEYRNIYMELRSRIVQGELEPETALPSEHLLCGEFQVSRPTIRRALGKLAEERLIIRRPGIGSFVAPPPEAETRRKIIGLDVGSLVNCAYYYQLIFAGVSQVCEECGIRLQLLPRGGIDKISGEEMYGVIYLHRRRRIGLSDARGQKSGGYPGSLDQPAGGRISGAFHAAGGL